MRQTSEVTDTQFPFVEDTTPFILVFNLENDLHGAEITGLVGEKDRERGFAHARTVDKKTGLVELAKSLRDAGVGCSLLACWPGGRHTDTFLVDDLDEALAALRI